MAGMLNKRSLLPLKLAVIFGLVAGYRHVNWILGYYDYLRYNLYNTTVRLLAVEVDRQVLIAAAVLYAIFLVITGIGKLRKRGRIACWSAIGCVAAVWTRCDVVYSLQQIDSTFFRAAYDDSKWQILASGLIIASLVLYLRTKRSRSKKSGQESASAPSVGFVWSLAMS